MDIFGVAIILSITHPVTDARNYYTTAFKGIPKEKKGPKGEPNIFKLLKTIQLKFILFKFLNLK